MLSDIPMVTASWTLLRNGKLRVDEFLTEIIRVRQELRICPPILDPVQPNPAVPYRSTGRAALPALPMPVRYRSERQAEALQVCSPQAVLRSEPGLEPCRSLRRPHQPILTSDRLLDLPVAS
ncbi:hypothetical protein SAMN02745898_101916 [Streptomyces sp. 136MFCol5.1]|jgi:hypothetical protein|uniref:hypothetical protein n=1 Tax=unclassified Streptomyces TaxID=2593676 RepID=UPI0008847C85|nr:MULTISPECIES: hypothetical protein [unclassified Streptomyces]SCY11325.1 hypothetical protein SAMN02745898_101916 [Streptomyces sp. 136MFCol5.1]SFS91473.1 hypothetical protein SAMN04487982_104419 [Streptomyces sp. ok210]